LIISIRPIIASKNLDFIRSNIVVLTEIIVDLKPENYDSFSIRISINRIGIFLNVRMYIYGRRINYSITEKDFWLDESEDSDHIKQNSGYLEKKNYDGFHQKIL